MYFFCTYIHTHTYKLVHTLYRGSAIARIVGSNASKHPEFQPEVKMWVFEEMINGKKLTEIINTEHENVKYLPGFKLPENIVSLIRIVVMVLINRMSTIGLVLISTSSSGSTNIIIPK